MANYKQTVLAGESYQRSNYVTISHPHHGTPQINFVEEILITLGDEVIHKPAGSIGAELTNPDTTFNLIDPLTGVATGASATHQDVYVLLNSLYFSLVTARDAT